ncbi:MAG: flavin monoamine oxidase family protein [Jejuia sp.]
MKLKDTDITIIGAGLTGLTLSYLLRNSNYNVCVIEARKRLGGRIYTSYKNDLASIEMGATWLGNQHTYLKTLLNDINLGIFEQELGEKAIYEPTSLSPHQLVTLPTNQEPSFRIKGGTSKIIETLLTFISKDNIVNGEKVVSLIDNSQILNIETDKNTYSSKIVVSTLPPRLFQSTVNVEPALPYELQQIMESTHTWMGESIKVGLRFNSPFWKVKDSSATIFSNVGPIPEFYDHSDHEANFFALKGFLNNSYYSLSKEARLDLILNQLRKYYGSKVEAYLEYEEKVWRLDPLTHSDYHDHVIPHQNNGHRLYQETYLNSKLFIAGAETSTEFPGYMEGAVRSAYNIFKRLDIR